MQLSNLPDYRAHLSRHGHNLSHDFDFTSATGHLLTVFAQIMNPKEHLKGHLEMFSRTQPLVGCPNVDIEEFVDYFFVPFDMLWSGFGDTIFQTNEPFSSTISVDSNGNLPLMHFDNPSLFDVFAFDDNYIRINRSAIDFYGLDNRFMSYYRCLFHNFINPNVLFYSVADELSSSTTSYANYAFPKDFFQPNVFPVVQLAYNCIYQNFYRLDDRESFVNSQYNIDSCMFNGDYLDVVFEGDNKFWSLKYRAKDFDYFSAGSVAPFVNPKNLSGGGSSLTDINNYLSSLNIGTVNSNSGITNPNVNSAGTAYSTSGNNLVSTQGLRSLFAVEKLLSVTNRAKKTYDAQVLAHFGVSVPTDYKHQIQFIGQQKGFIHVGEIISTAGTEENGLGDIAGKGYGNVSNNDIDFTAPCHGIVLGIFSCVPKIRYYAPLIKQFQLTNRLDFYFAEFEHLGMQPIFQWEAMAIPNNYVYKNTLDFTGRTIPTGWQMRYQQYKQQISRVSPAFAKTMIGNYYESGNQYAIDSFNSWSSWVISQRPYDVDFTPMTQNAPSLISYLAGPSLLNDIMAVQYPDVRKQNVNVGGYFDVWSDDYVSLESVSIAEANRKSFAWNIASLFYRDPLIHFVSNKFKLVSLMSDNTLPELAAV